jgi:DNA-binding transcriptional LysR family regulator
MNIDVTGLRAFACIAHMGSFHQAAKSLFVSQSALSRRIAKLEAQVGVRLLDRTTRRVKLTSVGRSFLPQAVRLVEELETSFAGLRDIAKRGVGHVTLACAPTPAIYLLPAVIREYGAKHPANRIRILDAHANEVLQSVSRGDAEFGITVAAVNDPDIVEEPLFTETFVLACRRDHPLARRRIVRWSDLEAHRVIAVGRRSGNHPLLEHGVPSVMPLRHWDCEVQHSTWTGLGMAEAGVGVVAVPASALSGGRHPKLVSRKLIDPEVTRTVSVIRRRGVTLSPAAHEFLTLLKQRARKAGSE